MKDSNLPLRKSYILKLNTPAINYAGVDVPVWYGEVPDDIQTNNYIVINQVNNNDTSTHNSNDTSTTIRVNIHTFDNKYNNGDAADIIAGEVLKRIAPANKAQIDLSGDGLQSISTEVVNDFTQDYSAQGARKYIDRILTFRHSIFQLS